MRWLIAVLYTAAGALHLAAPEKLLLITPSWVPFAPTVILLTGVFASLAVNAAGAQYALGGKYLGNAGLRPASTGDPIKDRVQKKNAIVAVAVGLGFFALLALLGVAGRQASTEMATNFGREALRQAAGAGDSARRGSM